MKKFYSIAVCFMLVSLNCLGQTSEHKELDWNFPQNFEYPIIGNITEKAITVRDTITQEMSVVDYEIAKYSYNIIQSQKFGSGYLVTFEYDKVLYYSVETYNIIANNPIEFGLYNRDKAKACFIGGAFVYLGGLAFLVSGGVCKDLSDNGRIALLSIGSSFAFAATATYIAGAVYQTRANRLFLVGCSNYGISATYKF